MDFEFLILLGCAVAVLVRLSQLGSRIRQVSDEQRASQSLLREIRDLLRRPEAAPKPGAAMDADGSRSLVTALFPKDGQSHGPEVQGDKPTVPRRPEGIPSVPPPVPKIPAPALRAAVLPQPGMQPSGPAPRQRDSRDRSGTGLVPESAWAILYRIWNWVLVGEEGKREGVALEYAIATTWLLRMGVVVIAVCMVFFLRLSADYVGPTGRVVASILVGVGLLIVGMQLVGRKYSLIGQGLLGAGVVTLYASLFSGGMVLNLFDLKLAFALMAFVTVTAGVIATRTDSMLIAILGILGGYLTPVLLRVTGLSLSVLYSYVLLLGIGVLAMARFKNWRLLNVLSFVCTYALFYGSLSRYTQTDFCLAISFLSVFFVIHSCIAYGHNILKANRSTVLEVIHLVANALLYAWTAYGLIHDAYGRPYPAMMSLGLAVFYLLHVVAFMRRQLNDRSMIIALIALAGAFSTWTLPLVLERESLTLSLSLIGFTFVWLGRRLDSHFIHHLGLLVYGVVFYRLLLMDLPRNFAVQADLPMREYWKDLVSRLWTFGVSIGSMASACFLENRCLPASRPIGVHNDTPAMVSARVCGGVFYGVALLCVFLFANLELHAMFRYWMPFRPPVLTALWCLMAAYFLWRYLDNGRPGGVFYVLMCVFAGMAVLKILSVDFWGWRLSDGLFYGIAYQPAWVVARFLDFGVALAALLLVAWRAGVEKDDRTLASVFGYVALGLLFIYGSLEVNTFCHWRLNEFRMAAVSILWSLFAISFVAGGIWRKIRPLRYIGLVLFAVVVGKVFLVDLEDLKVLYRVIAFMIVGLVLIAASFAYLQADRTFVRSTPHD